MCVGKCCQHYIEEKKSYLNPEVQRARVGRVNELVLCVALVPALLHRLALSPEITHRALID